MDLDDVDGTVLVASRASKPVGHLDDGDGSPVCDIELRTSRDWKSRDPADLPETGTLCRNCDPDYEKQTVHTGEQLSNRLEKMDPDEVVIGD